MATLDPIETSTLLPTDVECPFCGAGHVNLVTCHGDATRETQFRVECSQCHITTPKWDTALQAAQQWQSRQ